MNGDVSYVRGGVLPSHTLSVRSETVGENDGVEMESAYIPSCSWVPSCVGLGAACVLSLSACFILVYVRYRHTYYVPYRRYFNFSVLFFVVGHVFYLVTP